MADKTPESSGHPPLRPAISTDSDQTIAADTEIAASPASDPTDVPVTPGITRETYESGPSEESDHAEDNEGTGYFTQQDIKQALAASTAPEIEATTSQGPETEQVTGTEESKDFLRRLSIAVMGGRRESISEFRKSSPELALSGNVISATFNIPHSLKYRKGADWVR